MSTSVSAGPEAQRLTAQVLRWTARGILIAVTVFWIWFGIADGLFDAIRRGEGPMGFIMMLPAAVVCLAVLYVVWRWEFAGGLLLLAVTLVGVGLYGMNMRRIALHASGPGIWDGLVGLSIFVLPFLVPAVLLLIKSGMDRHAPPEASTPAA